MEWLPILKSMCNKYNVDFNLARAIISAETEGIKGRSRYEKHWKWFVQPQFHATRLRISLDTEMVHQAESFGLMQIMGAVARENGYMGYLIELNDYDKGLEYGVKHLSRLCLKYKEIEDVVASWNAGSPTVDINTGRYSNHEYVNKVMAVYELNRGIK